MCTKIKNVLLLILTAAIIFGLSAAGIIKTPGKYSLSERRNLAQMPEITSNGLLSGKFMADFEDYSIDQFPERDSFRGLKAVSSLYAFARKDNNGLYCVDGFLSKLEYPLNEARLEKSEQKLRQVYETYISDRGCRVYLSVIPDKNYFLAPLGGYPVMDYDRLIESMKDSLNFAEYIDIFGTLSLDDYYKTDQHWRQESLIETACVLAEGMGAEISGDFTVNTLDNPFYGVYCGQAALKFEPDTVKYLTNDILAGCTVTSYNSGEAGPTAMYDMEKAYSRDPYEMFLSGSDALLTIENPAAGEERELIIFRDSFGSSITPLLVSGYSRITLVDLRYIRSELLGSFIDFKGQDVLFLYSSLVLNNTILM